jgi:hypothetical protein
MQIFERVGEYDLVTHYEHFLMNYDWSQTSLSYKIGDWTLLGGQHWSDCDGFVRLSAVYRSCNDDFEKFVYIDLSSELLMKMVVGKSVEEISSEIPVEILEQVQSGS